jgi:hypothetical protein
LYRLGWQQHLRIPNYLSILSVILCSSLLLSFLVLPAMQSHRHYLSIGLLIPVLLISLAFAIPVSTNPSYCYDAITPSDMHDSMSCAWTGSLVTLGGLGCVVWVFLRSLWLFVRIVWDKKPGRRFMWGSIARGIFVPVIFLIAVLATTGFSYRMGQTCLPNQRRRHSNILDLARRLRYPGLHPPVCHYRLLCLDINTCTAEGTLESLGSRIWPTCNPPCGPRNLGQRQKPVHAAVAEYPRQRVCADRQFAILYCVLDTGQ